MNPKNPQAASELRERDRERFSDAGFNRWLDEGVSDGGHTVYDYIGGHESIPAAWHGWQAYADYSRPDDYETPEPTALQIEYARGYGDGVKHGESLTSQQLAAAIAERDELRALIDTPHTSEWFRAVRFEAAHQIKRWGASHDAGKAPHDWFWLIGYLAGKALHAAITGDDEKAKHHTISTGAALLNWFRAMTGDSNAMRPGIDDAAIAAGGEGDRHGQG